jgi:hypothetical protein
MAGIQIRKTTTTRLKTRIPLRKSEAPPRISTRTALPPLILLLCALFMCVENSHLADYGKNLFVNRKMGIIIVHDDAREPPPSSAAAVVSASASDDRHPEEPTTPKEQRPVLAPPFLQDLVAHLEPHCKVSKTFHDDDDDVAYLAIARAGSTSLADVFHYHDHDCTLRNLEERGARRVLVSLRHPVARISSGLSRRLEGHHLKKEGNRIFYETFKTPDAYVQALRAGAGGGAAAGDNGDVAVAVVDERVIKLAHEATIGHHKQNFMTPVSEFYLANPMGLADVVFLCIDTLAEDFDAAFAQRWHIRPPPNTKAMKHDGEKRKNVSHTSSANMTAVYSRFSATSLEWLLQTYAADVALFEKHCGKQQ